MEHSFPRNPALMGSLCLGLMQAFEATLGRLCLAHGNQAGDWLDELEQHVTNEIKGSFTEGVAMADEAAATQATLDVVGGIFTTLRQELAARP